jgi:hypothetical protein
VSIVREVIIADRDVEYLLLGVYMLDRPVPAYVEADLPVLLAEASARVFSNSSALSSSFASSVFSATICRFQHKSWFQGESSLRP